MRLCDTHRRVSESEFFEPYDLSVRFFGIFHAFSAVNFGDDRVDFFFNGKIAPIAEFKMIFFLRQTDDLFRKCFSALAALRPNGGQDDVDAQRLALFHDERNLGVGIGREGLIATTAGSL